MEAKRFGLQKKEEMQPTDYTTIKCGRCFSRQVVRVCHHCGEYLCKNCEPRLIKFLRRVHLYRFLFKDHRFFELHAIKRDFRLSAHCPEHIHYTETIYHLLIWIIIVIGIVGLIYSLLLSSGVWTYWAFGGLTTIAFFILLPTRGLIYRFIFSNQPAGPLLLLPTKFKVKLTESMNADFWIDKRLQSYVDVHAPSEGTNGKLNISLSPVLGDRKYRPAIVNNQSDICFFAGYIGLDNLEHVRFNQDYPSIKDDKTIVGKGSNPINYQGKLYLGGKMPIDIFERMYQNQTPVEIEQLYEIREKAGWVGPQDDKEFPFWIVPDLSLAHRKIDILIYVTPEIEERIRLERLSLKLPDKVTTDGIEIHGLLDTAASEVYWVNPNLRPGINEFSIKFREPVPYDVEFIGEYKISIDNFLLSGLKLETKDHLWFANGEPVPEPTSKKDEEDWLEGITKKTEFTGTFRFNTGIFKVRREFTASDEAEQRNCRPDHKLISKIAKILTDQNIEIKSITETPARIGDFRDGARLWDHYWEIKGRHYLEAELQYVEVHVVVYGQENWAILFNNHKAVGLQPTAEQTMPGSEMQFMAALPQEEYKQEFARWQLHLRAEIPIYNKEMACRIEQLCKKVGTKIREKVTDLAL